MAAACDEHSVTLLVDAGTCVNSCMPALAYSSHICCQRAGVSGSSFIAFLQGTSVVVPLPAYTGTNISQACLE
jgi:hypothetical protein